MHFCTQNKHRHINIKHYIIFSPWLCFLHKHSIWSKIELLFFLRQTPSRNADKPLTYEKAARNLNFIRLILPKIYPIPSPTRPSSPHWTRFRATKKYLSTLAKSMEKYCGKKWKIGLKIGNQPKIEKFIESALLVFAARCYPLFTNNYLPMQNLWLLSKIGCNSLLHIGLFATNERHFDVRVTDG